MASATPYKLFDAVLRQKRTLTELSVQWLIRDQCAAVGAGSLMVEAVRRANLPSSAATAVEALEAVVDVDEDILWKTSEAASDGFYGWIAGETVAVMNLCRYLIKERSIAREPLNLMGYWRYNKVGG